MIKNVTKEYAMKHPNLIVPIAYDIIYKEVFGKEENSDITALLVSSLLDIPYKEVKGKIIFKNSKFNKPKVMSKKGEKGIVFIVDTTEPFKINLEMNKYNINEPTIIRNSLYFSDTYASTLEEAEEYKSVPITIQFNFNIDYVDLVNKPLIDDYYYTNKYGHILTAKSKIVYINVAKMSEMWYSGEYKRFPFISPLIFLFSTIILENEKEKFDNLIKNKLLDKDIGNLIERIVYNMNDNGDLVSRYYDYEEERAKLLRSEILYEAEKLAPKVAQDLAKDMAKDMAEDIAKDMAKKIAEENNNEMIISMYQNGLSINEISKISKYSIMKIKSILKIK